MLCAAIAVVYGAFIAFVQTDLKYMIGFSSVSHMGLVMLGLSTLIREGLLGAGVQMFSHGVMTALFFAIVGMIYDRAHTRQIPELGGMAKVMPLACSWLYHRQSGFDGYAGFLGFCCGISDLPGGLEDAMVGGGNCLHFHHYYGGLCHAGRSPGFLWANARKI